MKYFVALLAALAIYFIFAIFAVGFGWSNGGGIVMQVFLFMAVAGVWTAITCMWPDSATHNGGAESQGEVQTQTNATSTAIDNAMKHDNEDFSTYVDDSQYYERAYDELSNQENLQRGVWAQAFSLTEGEEIKTKAKYIELRVAQLKKNAELTKHEDALQQQKRQQKRLQRQRAPVLPQIFTPYLPLSCPRCGTTQPRITAESIGMRFKCFPGNWFYTCDQCRQNFDLRESIEKDE